MSKVVFAEDAWNEYLYWQMEDKKVLKKINALLREIQRTPFQGSGKPEPLKGKNHGKWSRHINDKDRLVYEIINSDIVITQCKGHYTDK